MNNHYQSMLYVLGILAQMRAIRLAILFSMASLLTGCGHYPQEVSSRMSIALAAEDETAIYVQDLSLNDFPALSKFHNLRGIDFKAEDGKGGTDEKLEALAKIGFTKLSDVTLINCPLITDRGIEHLSKIESIRCLILPGTSVTDHGAEVLGSRMNLEYVDTSDCPSITRHGLRNLMQSESLKEVCLSMDGLSSNDLLELISISRHVTRITIVDPKCELDFDPIRKACDAKGIHVNPTTLGALHTFLGDQPWREWKQQSR